MDLGNIGNANEALRFLYESESLAIKKVCFDKEQDIDDTHEESRKNESNWMVQTCKGGVMQE